MAETILSDSQIRKHFKIDCRSSDMMKDWPSFGDVKIHKALDYKVTPTKMP